MDEMDGCMKIELRIERKMQWMMDEWMSEQRRQTDRLKRNHEYKNDDSL